MTILWWRRSDADRTSTVVRSGGLIVWPTTGSVDNINAHRVVCDSTRFKWWWGSNNLQQIQYVFQTNCFNLQTANSHGCRSLNQDKKLNLYRIRNITTQKLRTVQFLIKKKNKYVWLNFYFYNHFHELQ